MTNEEKTKAVNLLPAEGFLRLRQIIGDKKANPPIPPIIPVSRASWYEGVKDGRYPSPISLGPRTSVYKVESIRALIEQAGMEEGTHV
jgi:prophage regulatory protein